MEYMTIYSPKANVERDDGQICSGYGVIFEFEWTDSLTKAETEIEAVAELHDYDEDLLLSIISTELEIPNWWWDLPAKSQAQLLQSILATYPAYPEKWAWVMDHTRASEFNPDDEDEEDEEYANAGEVSNGH